MFISEEGTVGGLIAGTCTFYYSIYFRIISIVHRVYFSFHCFLPDHWLLLIGVSNADSEELCHSLLLALV